MVSVLGLPALLASRSGAEASRLASDEGWIVFVRNGIWVMDADGKNERQLTNDSTDGSPAWSPDGQQIAFTRDSGGYVCVMNADGANVRQITDGPLDKSPHWLPDGKRIGFTREVWEQENGQWIQKQGAIYLIDVSGENLEQLTESPPFFGRDAEWSPDGSAIIYYQLNLDAPNRIWIMDSNGQNRKMLYGWGYNPAWSPDGKKIAFGSEEAGWNIGGTYDIYVMDADGANVEILTKPDASTEDQPTWSPDGAEIAFVSNRDGNWDLYVMDSDGQNIRRLTNTPAVETSPDWTAFSYAVKPAGKLRKAWGWIKAR